MLAQTPVPAQSARMTPDIEWRVEPGRIDYGEALAEMERRYQMLSEAGVRNIAGFNKFVETQDAEKSSAKPAGESAKKAAPKKPK